MGNEAETFRAEELASTAMLAGIKITPEFSQRMLVRLRKLRTGVLEFSKTIDEDTAPATQFIAG